MYRNILVPLDGSPFAEHALPLALGLARRSGANLHFTHAHVPAAPMYGKYGMIADMELERIARLNEQAYLDQLVHRVSAPANVHVQTSLIEGDACHAIKKQSAAVNADLVVLSTHGRGPLSRFWLGSVAARLIRELPMPKLLVRPGVQPLDFACEPALRRLLIPLDGTPEAEQILEPAVELGRLVGTEFLLLQAVYPLPVPVPTGPAESFFWGMNVTPAQIDQVRVRQQQLEAEALAYLETIAERLRAQSLKVETRVVVCEQPATGILDGIETQSIDLVALETHGRKGLERLVMGSVADKIVRGSSTPVLLGRPLAK